jgi:RNA polymerase sigma-70 factor (ECF subfamily)
VIKYALMDDLSQLIERAQEGDKDAYGQIYTLFYKRIFRFCKFNTRDGNIAQDICQETFLKAWKALPNFSQKGGSLQAFLFKIARNLIIDLSRKKKEVALENYDRADPKQDLGERIEKQEDVERVRSALSWLEEEDRQIIVLRYFEDMTTYEVAKIVGIREGNLRVRTHRILKKLKEIMEEK